MILETLAAEEAKCAEGRTAPRVSLEDIKNNIAYSEWVTGEEAGRAALASYNPGGELPPSLSTLTIALVVLKNGFTIIGKSAPASPDNFNAELGKKLAFEDAVRQIWPLMGYELRERLYNIESAQPEV